MRSMHTESNCSSVSAARRRQKPTRHAAWTGLHGSAAVVCGLPLDATAASAADRDKIAAHAHCSTADHTQCMAPRAPAIAWRCRDVSSKIIDAIQWVRQVVKVIWQGRIAAAHGRFNCIHQVLPMRTFIHIHAPWNHPSPQPKRHLDRFSRFCRADDRDMWQTDRPTDRPRYKLTPSVTIDRTYIHRTAMRRLYDLFSAVKSEGVAVKVHCCYLALGKGAKYWDQRVSIYISACISQKPHVYKLHEIFRTC